MSELQAQGYCIDIHTLVKTISIIGGGLAGLALGIGLRRSGVPVTLYEASSYPRHRVCGEFICGVKSETLNNLGILHHLVDAEQCSTTSWYHHEKMVYQQDLPVAAFGISRYLLDFRLSRNFRKMGGQLHLQTRYPQRQNREGCVWTTGRWSDPRSPWIGLSLHCKNMHLTHDLEIHLGAQCYVGITRIEDQMVNICGLFRKRSSITAKKHAVPLAYLQACGLQQLTERIRSASIDFDSVVGISNLNFSRQQPPGEHLTLGDQHTMIPPFTGNGMSMAFESAETALEPLTLYAKGAINWQEALHTIRKKLRARLKKRLISARAIHPVMYSALGQSLLVKIAKTGCLPFNRVFRVTH